MSRGRRAKFSRALPLARWFAPLAVVAAAFAPALPPAARVAHSQSAQKSGIADNVEIVALTHDNTLVRFNAASPGVVSSTPITGASGTLVGIDVRPADARLYALSDGYDLYVIDAATGKAKSASTLTAPFDGGTHSGFDFNPQADRLRLVAENGQNLRVHVDLGAAATDGALTYAPKDANAGTRPRLAAAAYTRSIAGAATTQLFNIDAGTDVLVLQDPPNDGVLRTIGSLGVDFDSESGFDILSGPGESERAFAATGSVLYRVDLATGAAVALGTIGDGTLRLVGLAVLPKPFAAGN
ncbi:MAG: DUF4394 domain-containing protein [bacterium]